MEYTDGILERYKENPDEVRYIGKELAFGKNKTAEERILGIEIIKKLSYLRDWQATYLLGMLLITGRAKISEDDSVKYGLELIRIAAEHGCMEARAMLDKYYEEKYRTTMSEYQQRKDDKGPLTDFDGKQIKINRTGIRTPVDAQLKYIDGKNILLLELNLKFMIADDQIEDPDAFATAVYKGVKDWEGEYTVFGGQKLEVQINATVEDRLFDNVQVIPVTAWLQNFVKGFSDTVGIKEENNSVLEAITTDRSFATSGIKKWSVTSQKKIYICSQKKNFTDYDEIRHVAKHEFGHVLGLGDLYFSPKDGLYGVQKDEYPELESYRINDRMFYLVMCDHHAPVSNNDIEMVILAFSENRKQNYQMQKGKGEISKALGKGN